MSDVNQQFAQSLINSNLIEGSKLDFPKIEVEKKEYISAYVEKSIVKDIEKYAKKHNTSKSAIINFLLKKALSSLS